MHDIGDSAIHSFANVLPLENDLTLRVGKRIIFDSDADGNNMIYAPHDTYLTMYVEGIEIWRAYSSGFYSMVTLRPKSESFYDLGAAGNYRWGTIYGINLESNVWRSAEFDVALKAKSALGIYIRNKADTAYLDLYCKALQIDGGSIISPTGIDFKPSLDIDDYVRFYTSSNILRLKVFGNSYFPIETDDPNWSRLILWENASEMLDFGWYKTGHYGRIYCTHPIYLMANSDQMYYIQYSIDNLVPKFTTIRSNKLAIESDDTTYAILDVRENAANHIQVRYQKALNRGEIFSDGDILLMPQADTDNCVKCHTDSNVPKFDAVGGNNLQIDGIDVKAHAENINAHHNEAHTLASHSTKAHSELTGVTPDLHHAENHALASIKHSAGNDKIFYSNGSGVITELGLGAANTYLKSQGAGSAPTFDTPAGEDALARQFLMIGIDNKDWAPCVSRQEPTIHGSWLSQGATGFYISVTATDNYLYFQLPLPALRFNDYKLYVDGLRLIINNADATDDYVDGVTLRGLLHTGSTNLWFDGTDRKAQGTYDYSFTPVDCSAYSLILVELLCRVNSQLQISGVLLRCFYVAPPPPP